jgi:RimJ/RimL family protein N-acetyltransferase
MARLEPKALTLADGTRITVRSLVLADGSDMLAFRRHAATTSEHNVTQPDELENSIIDEERWIAEHVEDPGRLAIIAELPPGHDAPPGRSLPCGRILGELDFRPGKRRVMRHHGRFGISVVEGWRGLGIGRLLITTLLDWARGHEYIEKVCLGVFENNTGARRLYTALGFVEESRHTAEFKMPDGRYVDDIQMSQWVKARGG